MTEQAPESGRTSIGLTWPVYQRLAAFRRQVNAAESKDYTLGEAIDRLLDFADAADLP